LRCNALDPTTGVELPSCCLKQKPALMAGFIFKLYFEDSKLDRVNRTFLEDLYLPLFVGVGVNL
jgi:hypothetical protein